MAGEAKSNKTNLIIFGIVALVLVAGGAIYFWYKNKSANATQQLDTTKSITTTGQTQTGATSVLSGLQGVDLSALAGLL
jgi:hypothetical protein